MRPSKPTPIFRIAREALERAATAAVDDERSRTRDVAARIVAPCPYCRGAHVARHAPFGIRAAACDQAPRVEATVHDDGSTTY